jgi:hypothetical protein
LITNSRKTNFLRRRLIVAAGCLATVVAGTAPDAARAAVDPSDPAVVVRRITFPVQGGASYRDDFGDPRVGHTHQGNDLMVPKLRPLVAATDATVRRIFVDDGTATQGNMLVLRDADGWEYWYLHINNDTPGTDDALNPPAFNFAAGIVVGARVTAGQVVAFAGDSGDAETAGSHLHFELHPPGTGTGASGAAVDPYPSLRLSQGFRFGNYCAFDTNPVAAPSAASAPGYWLLGGDGGVFSFGTAGFFGSTGSIKLNRPAVAMAATPSGRGYWFAATDGGIFAFGDAGFYGSTGAIALNQPIVGLAATPTGHGYWLVARDGGIFAFGDAPYEGSPAGTGLCDRPAARRLAPSASGRGYWVASADGSVAAFGDARDYGSPKGLGITAAAAYLDLVPAPAPPPASDGAGAVGAGVG